jgi:hypothetical protein
MKQTTYHMQDAAKFPRIDDSVKISRWPTLTIAFIVGVGAGVVLADVAFERRASQVQHACADHVPAGYSGFAMQNDKGGYTCVVMPNDAQPWSFSPNIIIERKQP